MPAYRAGLPRRYSPWTAPFGYLARPGRLSWENMEEDPTPRRRLPAAEWLRALVSRWGPARVGLLLAGFGLIAFSATFVLAGGWSSDPGSSSAEEGGQASLAEATQELTFGAGLDIIDQESLDRALYMLAAELKPTPSPTNTPKPTPTPRPTEPPPDRTDCGQIRGTPYRSPQEREWFLANCIIEEPAPPPAAPPSDPPPSDPGPSDPPPSSGGCPAASMSGFGLALFNAANSQRTQNGLPALAAHGCVTYVANIRSQDMAANGYFSHTSPNGSTAFSLMDQYGVSYGWAGENLARNNYPDSETVNVAITDLMNSQGHRDNILSTNYTAMGVACVVDGAGMKYFTMIFIGPG